MLRAKFLTLSLTALVAVSFLLSAPASIASDTAAPSFKSDFSNTLSDRDLDSNRGTFAPGVYNLSNLTAVMYGNSANNTVSGNNNIGDGAFSGLNGLATVIQNSGNNVVIQSSTVLNVTFDSTPVTP
jgi:hypothetical protein